MWCFVLTTTLHLELRRERGREGGREGGREHKINNDTHITGAYMIVQAFYNMTSSLYKKNSIKTTAAVTHTLL